MNKYWNQMTMGYTRSKMKKNNSAASGLASNSRAVKINLQREMKFLK
jgi:hypothetical protein